MTSIRSSWNTNLEFNTFSAQRYIFEAPLSPPHPLKRRRILDIPRSKSASVRNTPSPPMLRRSSFVSLSTRSNSPFSPEDSAMASSDDPNKGYDDKEWKGIEDREERRRIQNRNAQRRHRDRRRQEDEEKQRIASNQQSAGSAYTPARFEDVNKKNPDGLPWGAFALTSKDASGSTKNSPFSSPEMSTKDRKASFDSIWDDYSQTSLTGTRGRLEVPRVSSRGLASSSSVPQLREAALAGSESSIQGLVRSKSSSNSSRKRKQEEG